MKRSVEPSPFQSSVDKRKLEIKGYSRKRPSNAIAGARNVAETTADGLPRRDRFGMVAMGSLIKLTSSSVSRGESASSRTRATQAKGRQLVKVLLRFGFHLLCSFLRSHRQPEQGLGGVLVQFAQRRWQLLVVPELYRGRVEDCLQKAFKHRIGHFQVFDRRYARICNAFSHGLIVRHRLDQFERCLRVRAGLGDTVEVIAHRADHVVRVAFATRYGRKRKIVEL